MQLGSCLLGGGLENLRIEAETGTSDVELVGHHITGIWMPNPKIVRVGSPRPVAAELLNLDQHATGQPFERAALKFTKKFGPITIPCQPGLPFRFAAEGWLHSVARLMGAWEAISNARRRTIPINVPLAEGEYFNFAGGRLTFRTRLLYTFMALEIASVRSGLLRKCANVLNPLDGNPRPDFCRTPYFVASDKREKYCSEACAKVGKRRANLRWWNENRKGGEDGTQKAR